LAPFWLQVGRFSSPLDAFWKPLGIIWW
jgi:hypothetical protein